MLITRTSIISGTTHTMDIQVTEQQFEHWLVHGIAIQDAMQELTDEQREFIMTGITPDEWHKLCQALDWDETLLAPTLVQTFHRTSVKSVPLTSDSIRKSYAVRTRSFYGVPHTQSAEVELTEPNKEPANLP